MSKIRQVKCRPKQLRSDAPALVLEIGKPLPEFYQIGRSSSALVKHMSGRDPIFCELDRGDPIYLEDSIILATIEDE